MMEIKFEEVTIEKGGTLDGWYRKKSTGAVFNPKFYKLYIIKRTVLEELNK